MMLMTMPKKDPARWAWIKYQLELRGYTLGSLARELGVDRSIPAKVLHGRYPKMQAAIAERLGTAPELLWPERYESKPKAAPGGDARVIRRRKNAA